METPDATAIITANSLHLDNTKRSSWCTCKRKYFYNFVKNIRPRFGSTALRYGVTWHAGLEAFYQHIKDNGWTRDGSAIEIVTKAMQHEWTLATEGQEFYSDYRTLENCMRAFLMYLGHFSYDEHMLKVIDVEKEFRILMTPTEEEQALYPHLSPFLFTGKRDLKVELDGRKWIMEHKTTGQSIQQQAHRLHRSAQIMGYTYAENRIEQDEEPAEGCLIALHSINAYKSKTTGSYGEPKFDFLRVPQIFSDNDIAQWRLSFMSVAQEIQIATEANNFPMCHDACFNFGNCPYLPLCEQAQSQDLHDIPITDAFKIGEEWNPGAGTEVIE